MSTIIQLVAADIALATTLITPIHSINSAITTPTQVLVGAVTVGLNRLLSRYSTTPEQRILIMEIGVSTPALIPTTITVSATDAVRIAAIVSELAFTAGSTTADVTGCAARTGLALLAGGNVLLPPLRS